MLREPKKRKSSEKNQENVTTSQDKNLLQLDSLENCLSVVEEAIAFITSAQNQNNEDILTDRKEGDDVDSDRLQKK